MSQENRGWLDDRLDFKKTWDWFLNRRVPRGVGWWYVLGSATMISFIVLAVTGIFLLLNYSPSPDHAYDSIQYNIMQVPFGALIRSIHFYAASAMVILVVLHLLRVYFMGAYKYPREVNWILGAILLFLVLFASFTGYLLPWDQRAYWATNVASGIAGSVPLIGVWIQKLLIGGTQIGTLTLSRFFAAHVGIIPAFIGIIMFIHVFIVIRLGISAPPGLMKTTSMPGKSRKEVYEAQYEASKKGGESFFPSTIARDTIFGVLVVAVIIALALIFPHGSEAPADPTSLNYNPRPEWYFLFLFQFLKLFPGSLEPVAAVIIPLLAIIVLIAVPFIDRGASRFWTDRRPALAIGGVVVVVLIALEVWGALSAPARPGGLENQQVLDGQKVYRDINCSYCHSINGIGGAIGPDLSNVASQLTKDQITQYLQNPDSMVPNTLHPKLQFTSQELNGLVAYLETLGAPVSYSAQAPQLFSQNCSICHTLNGQGGSIGPDLSHEGTLRTINFLQNFISDPKSADLSASMPSFNKTLSTDQINDLANYLYSQKAPITTPKTSPTPTSTPTPTPTPTSTPAPAAKLNAVITRVDIAPDRSITVYYTLTDDKGAPVTRAALDANRERFSIARLAVDPVTQYTQWLSYVTADVQGAVYKLNGVDTQPALAQVSGVPVSAEDTGGIFKEIVPGQYAYTYKTILPADYDKNATTRVIYQASKDSRAVNVNASYDFVPAGGPVTATRQLVATSNCNQCHDPLSAHGGGRYDTKLCVVCHTPQNVDPASGNSVDFKVLIHKIHDGQHLPSVVAKGTFNIGTSDFSDVGFPQDVRNCTTCHSNAPDADNYKNNPSRAACGACHDQIDWTTGKSKIAGQPDHAGGAQADDKNCKTCHQPDSGKEFDASIVGAHTIPAKSKQLKGVNLSLIAASVSAGQKPSVDFSIKDNGGAAIDPNTMDAVEFVIGYPTADYGNNANGQAEYANRILAATATPFVRTGVLTSLGNGNYRYTFANAVSATWTTGSVGIGMIGYKNTTIKGNYGKDTVVRETSLNPVIYVSLDGTAPVARRVVVDRNKCNACHLDLGSPAGIAVHGGSRRNTQLCVICHNANQTDEVNRTAATLPPESVQFKYMIHSLHMGQDRAVATTFSSTSTTGVAYPTSGAQKDCLKCHLPGTYSLPLPPGALPMTITQAGKVVKVVQPITAVCMGCHAGQTEFDSHAATYTTADEGEQCVNCHGTGKPMDVVTVHAN